MDRSDETFRSGRRLPTRAGRVYLAVVTFMMVSAAVLLIVMQQYLLPAMQAAKGVDATGKRQLAAISSLVLAVVLVSLFAILLVVFRPGRMFLPRRREPRQRTTYPDAWSEAGERLQTPPPEEEGEDGSKET